jgi:hypothetical protein
MRRGHQGWDWDEWKQKWPIKGMKEEGKPFLWPDKILVKRTILATFWWKETILSNIQKR